MCLETFEGAEFDSEGVSQFQMNMTNSIIESYENISYNDKQTPLLSSFDFRIINNTK